MPKTPPYITREAHLRNLTCIIIEFCQRFRIPPQCRKELKEVAFKLQNSRHMIVYLQRVEMPPAYTPPYTEPVQA